MKLKQIISIFLIIFLITTLTLFVLKRISAMYFWVVAAVTGLIAFKVIPKMN